MHRPTISRRCAGNSLLALLALWGFLAFDAAHIVHHVNDDESPFSHDVGSHAWWDGILFHTGTLAEPVFFVCTPERPLLASLAAEKPVRVDGIPLLVPESRAPPAA